MIRLLLTLLVIAALEGCTFCRTHDRTCALAGGVALTSLALTIHGGHSRPGVIQPDVPTPSVNCANPESCR